MPNYLFSFVYTHINFPFIYFVELADGAALPLFAFCVRVCSESRSEFLRIHEKDEKARKAREKFSRVHSAATAADIYLTHRRCTHTLFAFKKPKLFQLLQPFGECVFAAYARMLIRIVAIDDPIHTQTYTNTHTHPKKHEKLLVIQLLYLSTLYFV